MYKQSYAARLDTLARALERRRMEQNAPVDGLSESLYQMGAELAALDEQRKAAFLRELNEDGFSMTMDELSQFISDFQEV